jgi:hypothetical protein
MEAGVSEFIGVNCSRRKAWCYGMVIDGGFFPCGLPLKRKVDAEQARRDHINRIKSRGNRVTPSDYQVRRIIVTMNLDSNV